MKRYIIGLIISGFIYLFVLSLAHSYYLTKINNSMELTIQDLVDRIVELQKHQTYLLEAEE